jgi:hypothetical protein
MQATDTRKLIMMLYILTLMFLGTIYFQSEAISQPEVIATLKQIDHSGMGNHSIQIMSSFRMSGETILFTALSLTLFFGFAWYLSPSKTY